MRVPMTMIRLFTQKLPTGMLATRSLQNVRFISQTGRTLEKSGESKTPAASQSPAAQPAADAAPAQGPPQAWKKKSQTRILSSYDKRMLVWTGKYKSIDDVPSTVPHETLDRARDKFRVKMCIWMMIACTGICIIQVIRGKQAAERGESVVKSNLDWHREYNEAAAKKQNESK